jgi:hypothetical protein
MLSRLPKLTTVGFCGANWAAEAEKSQQGFDVRGLTVLSAVRGLC